MSRFTGTLLAAVLAVWPLGCASDSYDDRNPHVGERPPLYDGSPGYSDSGSDHFDTGDSPFDDSGYARIDHSDVDSSRASIEFESTYSSGYPYGVGYPYGSAYRRYSSDFDPWHGQNYRYIDRLDRHDYQRVGDDTHYPRGRDRTEPRPERDDNRGDRTPRESLRPSGEDRQQTRNDSPRNDGPQRDAGAAYEARKRQEAEQRARTDRDAQKSSRDDRAPRRAENDAAKERAAREKATKDRAASEQRDRDRADAQRGHGRAPEKRDDADKKRDDKPREDKPRRGG